MRFIVRELREQIVLISTCLEELAGPDNEARVINQLVSSFDLKGVGSGEVREAW